MPENRRQETLFVCLLLAGTILAFAAALSLAPGRVETAALMKDEPARSRSSPAPGVFPSSKKMEVASHESPEAPVHLRRFGRVRLKPGETAVQSYWKTEPGENGMTLVTPSRDASGNVVFDVRMLSVSDDAIDRLNLHGWFPGIFDLDRLDTAENDDAGNLLETLEANPGSSILKTPRMITGPGTPVTMASKVNRSGGEWLGFSLSLRASPLDDGGFDLDIDLDSRSTAKSQ